MISVVQPRHGAPRSAGEKLRHPQPERDTTRLVDAIERSLALATYLVPALGYDPAPERLAWR